MLYYITKTYLLCSGISFFKYLNEYKLRVMAIFFIEHYSVYLFFYTNIRKLKINVSKFTYYLLVYTLNILN